jgi:hypothetical protein
VQGRRAANDPPQFRALIGGQTNPKVLAQGRMRAKINQLEEAFTGHFTDHHALLLSKMLARIDALDADIAELDTTIGEMIAPFAPAVEKLDQIPGVGTTAARVIIAEVGVDMSRFPTAAHLASWARFTPRVNNQLAARKTAAPPDTATAISPARWVKPPWPPARPTPSSANVTDASPAARAKNEPSSPLVAPSWSSSGTCYPTPRPDLST